MTGEHPNGRMVVRRKNDIKRKFLQRVGDWLFGYDFFISYCWKDGRKYAVGLAEQLTKNGYACFLDSTNYAMGDDWKLVGERALRHSSQCVLVATQGARKSKPVLREITIFRGLGRRIVPIQFDNSLVDDGELCELRQLLPDEILRISKPSLQLNSGPDDEVLQSIITGFKKQTQEQKRTKFFAAATVVFAALSVVAITFWVQAVRAKNEALNLNANSTYDLGQFACTASRERLGLLQLARGLEICRDAGLDLTQTYEQSLSLWSLGLAVPAGYIPSGNSISTVIDPIAIDLNNKIIVTVRFLDKSGALVFDFYDLPSLAPSLRYPPVTISDLDVELPPVFSLDLNENGVVRVAWLDQAKLNDNGTVTGDLSISTFDPESKQRNTVVCQQVEVDEIIQCVEREFLATVDNSERIQFWSTKDNKLSPFAQLDFKARRVYMPGNNKDAPMFMENWMLSKDGRLLAIEHEDRLVRIWNTSDGTLHLTIRPPQSPNQSHQVDFDNREWGTSILFSEDDSEIWTCSDGNIRCWSSSDGTLFGGADNTGLNKLKYVSRDGEWVAGEYQHTFKVSRTGSVQKSAVKLFEVLGSREWANNLQLRQIIFGFQNSDLYSASQEVNTQTEGFYDHSFGPPAPVIDSSPPVAIEPQSIEGDVNSLEPNSAPPVPFDEDVPPAPEDQELPPAPEYFETSTSTVRVAGQEQASDVDSNFSVIENEQNEGNSLPEGPLFPLIPPKLFIGNAPVSVVLDIVFHPSKPLAFVQLESGGQVWDLTFGRQTLARTLPYGNDTALVEFGPLGDNVDAMITTDMTGTRSFVLDKNSVTVNPSLSNQHFQSEHASGNIYTCRNPFAISPDGRVLAEFNDETLKLWDLRSFLENGRWDQVGQTLELEGWDIDSVNFSPDSSSFVLITFKDKGFLPLFESKDAKIIRVSTTNCEVMQEQSPILASRLSMSKDTRFIVGNVSLNFGDSLMAEHTEVNVIDSSASDGSPKTFSQDGIIEFAELSPRADLLFTAADNRVIFWDVKSEEKIFEITHAADIIELVCFDDGKKLFVATDAGSMRVWDVKKKTPQFTEIAHTHQIGLGYQLYFAASSDSSCFATGGDEWVRIWNTETGKQIGPDIPTSGSVESLSFVQNDRLLAIKTSNSETTFLRLQTTASDRSIQPAWIERLAAATLSSSGTLVPTLDLSLKSDNKGEAIPSSIGTRVEVKIVPLDSESSEEQPGPGKLPYRNGIFPDSDVTPSDPDESSSDVDTLPLVPAPVVDYSA